MREELKSKFFTVKQQKKNADRHNSGRTAEFY